MRLTRFFRDTIALRLALTTITTILVAAAIGTAFSLLSGDGGRPPLDRPGLMNEVAVGLRMLEAAPREERPALAEAASSSGHFMVWVPALPDLPPALRGTPPLGEPSDEADMRPGEPAREVRLFSTGDLPPRSPLRFFNGRRAGSPRIAAIRLEDGSWAAFSVGESGPGPSRLMRRLITLTIGILSIILVALASTRLLARPIEHFTRAAERFGRDPKAAPITETGPLELRRAARAFNQMQASVQRFIEDRTQMVAAISHDLRTPITRLRLRAEFVEDEEQRERILGDLDQMAEMIEATLAFARDDAASEALTPLDLPSLLESMADEAVDAGHEASYSGPAHRLFRGRPVALRRAFGNLVDNAIKYGEAVEIGLEDCEGGCRVTIADRGPGIPIGDRERVFAPFVRLEGSRNRDTGGTGLGLSIARTIIRGHGGEIHLNDRAEGGLVVVVTLPG